MHWKEFFQFLLLFISEHQGPGYLVIFLVSFLESLAFVGLFIPGTTFMVFVGFLASKGFFNIPELFIVAVAGAIAGDALSFFLGSHSNVVFSAKSKIFKLKYLQTGEGLLKKYGDKSVFVGRFLGPIRPIIPFVAGMFKMEPKKFYFWNILSAIGWGTLYLSLGYFFGAAWDIVARWSRKLSFTLLIGVILIILVYWVVTMVKAGQKK